MGGSQERSKRGDVAHRVSTAFRKWWGSRGTHDRGIHLDAPLNHHSWRLDLYNPTTLKVGNSIERGSCPTFVTPFSREILEAPCLSKVKMPSVDLFDETTDPDDHVDVYKAQMYVQDVDDATCCRYVPATLKGIAQKWFTVGECVLFFPVGRIVQRTFCS